MAFPQIDHCIVCDEVRLEPAGKASILGFYGIVPQVELGVIDFGKPLPKLCFVFIGGPGSGASHVEFSLSGSSLQSESRLLADISVDQNGTRSVFIFAVAPISFKGPGDCRVVLRVGEEDRYGKAFAVVQGKLPPQQ